MTESDVRVADMVEVDTPGEATWKSLRRASKDESPLADTVMVGWFDFEELYRRHAFRGSDAARRGKRSPCAKACIDGLVSSKSDLTLKRKSADCMNASSSDSRTTTR